jgi:hypothetical protein
MMETEINALKLQNARPTDSSSAFVFVKFRLLVKKTIANIPILKTTVQKACISHERPLWQHDLLRNTLMAVAQYVVTYNAWILLKMLNRNRR